MVDAVPSPWRPVSGNLYSGSSGARAKWAKRRKWAAGTATWGQEREMGVNFHAGRKEDSVKYQAPAGASGHRTMLQLCCRLLSTRAARRQLRDPRPGPPAQGIDHRLHRDMSQFVKECPSHLNGGSL